MITKINKKTLEKAIGKKIITGISSFGVDTASRAGVARSHADKDWVYVDCFFVEIKTTDLFFKYDKMFEVFHNTFKEVADKPENYKVVIEDTFFGKNVNVLKQITRLGMIVYISAKLAGINDISFIYPTSSRKNIGINSKLKKKEVHEALCKMLEIKDIDDSDIADAIILSINGLIKEK